MSACDEPCQDAPARRGGQGGEEITRPAMYAVEDARTVNARSVAGADRGVHDPARVHQRSQAGPARMSTLSPDARPRSGAAAGYLDGDRLRWSGDDDAVSAGRRSRTWGITPT